MSKISLNTVTTAAKKLQRMSLSEKEKLADQFFKEQPNIFGSFLVQPKLGVSPEKMETLLNIMFVCFLAMKESGLKWPIIKEEEQEQQLSHIAGMENFQTGLTAALKNQSAQQYIDSHPEKYLLAFVMGELNHWLAKVNPEETDKYVMLTALTFVNCIGYNSVISMTCQPNM